MTTRLPGPLGGTRVVTFAAFYQGPYATTLLADLGADVITADVLVEAFRPGTMERFGLGYPRLSEYAEHDPGPAPRLGEHTAPLLRELDDTSPYPEEVTEP